METFFGKRSLLINIKIKAVMNKNIFSRDISIYFLKSFSSKSFYKIFFSLNIYFLSKVFERLISLRFGRFLERSGVLSSHQYSYRKSLGTCDALLDIVCAGQMVLDRGGELALVQIDFSAAFDRVNHGDLVFKLRERSWRCSKFFCPVVLRELR